MYISLAFVLVNIYSMAFVEAGQSLPKGYSSDSAIQYEWGRCWCGLHCSGQNPNSLPASPSPPALLFLPCRNGSVFVISPPFICFLLGEDLHLNDSLLLTSSLGKYICHITSEERPFAIPSSIQAGSRESLPFPNWAEPRLLCKGALRADKSISRFLAAISHCDLLSGSCNLEPQWTKPIFNDYLVDAVTFTHLEKLVLTQTRIDPVRILLPSAGPYLLALSCTPFFKYLCFFTSRVLSALLQCDI